MSSIDGRNGPVHRGQHWSDDKALGGRAFLELMGRSPGLVLEAVRASDQDLYRCRVDYDIHPTRNVRVQLNVIGASLPRPASLRSLPRVRVFFRPSPCLVISHRVVKGVKRMTDVTSARTLLGINIYFQYSVILIHMTQKVIVGHKFIQMYT